MLFVSEPETAIEFLNKQKEKVVLKKIVGNTPYHAVIESWPEFAGDSLNEKFLHCHVVVKREQELTRLHKREFAWEFSQVSRPGQTRTRVAWELKRVGFMKVFSTLMSWWNENKSCTRVDVSWRARCFLTTLMSWSNKDKSCMNFTSRPNENKSWLARVCMRADERWQAWVCMRVFSTLMPWSNENKSCMRVDKLQYL